MTIRTTPTWGLPYPDSAEHTRTWEFWQALAEAVDTKLTTVKNGIPNVQTGSVSMAINAATSGTVTLTWPRAFTATPSCATNMTTGSGSTSDWKSRMITVSATGGTVFAFGPTLTLTFTVQWIAALNAAAPIAVGAGVGSAGAPPPPAPRSEDGWHTVTATCHTPGCPNEDVPVPGISIPDDPAAWGWTGVACGACGQPITDLT